MRVVGKFNGHDIRLDSLHMSETYGGFLLGPSEKRMEESNLNILKELEGSKCARLFGDDRPTLIVGIDGFDLKKPLPSVYVLAWLSCGAVIRDTTEDGSHLILIWLQDAVDDPFAKLSAFVSSLDWGKHARDFGF